MGLIFQKLAHSAAFWQNITLHLQNEIKYVPTIDSAELRRRYEEAVSRLRKLDLLIQSVGWNTELITED